MDVFTEQLTCGECGVAFRGDPAMVNGAMHGHWRETHGYTDGEQLTFDIDVTSHLVRKAVVRRATRVSA